MDVSNYAIIDVDALNENTMSDSALQQELFAIFFEQSDVYLAQMAEAIEADDAEAWRMTAHGIKGVARALGLVRIEKLSHACENGTFTQAAFESLAKLVAQAREHLETRMAA